MTNSAAPAPTIAYAITPATRSYCVAVKTSSRGRTLYRADSASICDRDTALAICHQLAAENPTIPVAIADADADLPMRPSHLRLAHDALYDDCGDDEDVNVDELADAEL